MTRPNPGAVFMQDVTLAHCNPGFYPLAAAVKTTCRVFGRNRHRLRTAATLLFAAPMPPSSAIIPLQCTSPHTPELPPALLCLRAPTTDHLVEHLVCTAASGNGLGSVESPTS